MATDKIVTLNDLKQFVINMKSKFVGSTQLTSKQDKADNRLQTTDKTVVGGINEILLNGLYSGTSGVASNNAVFNFTNTNLAADTSRIVQTKPFQGNMTNPITGNTINGTILTKQYMVKSGGAFTIYIEQEFTQLASAVKNNVIKFYRKGSVALDSLSQYTNWVASKGSSITWLDWIPIYYPAYSVANIPISGKGQLSYIMIAISGGNMTIRGIYSCTSGGVNVDTEIMTFPFKIKIGNVNPDVPGSITTYYDKFPNANLTGTIDAIFDNQNKFRVVPTATGDFRICCTIPLGY